MICPNCKCEYIRGVTECADCGVALVDKLEPEEGNPSQDVRIVSVWQGGDPTEYERVKAALEQFQSLYSLGFEHGDFCFRRGSGCSPKDYSR
jgi:hypothetical protein